MSGLGRVSSSGRRLETVTINEDTTITALEGQEWGNADADDFLFFGLQGVILLETEAG